MPHLQHKSQNLHLAGPAIEVFIVPPQQVIEEFKAKGQTAPVQKAIALIDTGATCTCIDKTIAQALKLVSHDIKRCPNRRRGRYAVPV